MEENVEEDWLGPPEDDVVGRAVLEPRAVFKQLFRRCKMSDRPPRAVFRETTLAK